MNQRNILDWNFKILYGFVGYRSQGLKKRRRRKRESKWSEKQTNGRKRRSLLEQNWPTKANMTLWESILSGGPIWNDNAELEWEKIFRNRFNQPKPKAGQYSLACFVFGFIEIYFSSTISMVLLSLIRTDIKFLLKVASVQQWEETLWWNH